MAVRTAALCVALALLACSSCASASEAKSTNNQTYAALPPQKLVLSLSFPGAANPTPAPCTLTAPGSPCLPQVSAGVGQAVTVTYSLNSTYPANTNSTVKMMRCFGPESTKNRAWRKANPVISLDKQCKQIAVGLPSTGSYTWLLDANVPPAVYKFTALEVCADGLYCGIGSSTFFQALAIDSTPTWLLAMTGAFAAIGPISMVGYFVYEQKMKKHA